MGTLAREPAQKQPEELRWLMGITTTCIVCCISLKSLAARTTP